MSPFAAGLTFLPMMLVGAILTPFSARMAERVGTRSLITAGLVLMAAGLAILAVAPRSTSIRVVAVLMVPVGLAGALLTRSGGFMEGLRTSLLIAAGVASTAAAPSRLLHPAAVGRRGQD